MKKHSIFYALTILMFVLPSCTGNNVPATTPTVDATTVAAVVSTMLAGAAPTPTVLPEATPTLAPTSTPEPQTMLPRSLYYSLKDANGIRQLYRLGRDGVTITQITFEQGEIIGFGISPADGSVVYVVGNKLIVTDANGANSRILIEDPNVEHLRRPTWSPDGRKIAYDDGRDVLLYSFDAGRSDILIAGSDKDEKYPVSFSPDGRKLIIRQHFIPSSPESKAFVYDFASQTLNVIPGGEIRPYPCFGYIAWNSPNTLFCNYYALAGAVFPGLWRVNVNDGSVEPLAGSGVTQPPFRLIAAPHQDPSGNLYYLYTEADGTGNPSAFSFMRSKSDGLTERVLARPEMFNVLETLWTPDGTSLLIVQNNGENNFPVNILLVPVDPSKPVVTVISDASQMDGYYLRWGQ